MIIGLDKATRPRRPARLYHYEDIKGEPEEMAATEISPYLFDTGGKMDHRLVVREEGRPINGWRHLIIGSKPIDGGHYIIDEDEYESLRQTKPDVAQHFRPYIGAREFINGECRYIVHPDSISPQELTRLPEIRERMDKVRALRMKSRSAPTRALASFPGSFHVTVIPETPFLVVPEVSSERREYLPIGWLEPPTIPSNLLRVLLEATPLQFALLTSAMHMAWLRAVGGRLKNDYRYSIGVVYNAFPVPQVAAKDVKKIEALAQAILEARAQFPDATLADLYDPDTMPTTLRRAHHALDHAVDRLYRRAPFKSEHDRLQHLFKLYQVMKQPLI
ncbi:MAG: type IIL restriction-modification enzyme MmeI [Candidatus Puniceispirillaceae bacterium]